MAHQLLLLVVLRLLVLLLVLQVDDLRGALVQRPRLFDQLLQTLVALADAALQRGAAVLAVGDILAQVGVVLELLLHRELDPRLANPQPAAASGAPPRVYT